MTTDDHKSQETSDESEFEHATLITRSQDRVSPPKRLMVVQSRLRSSLFEGGNDVAN